MNEWRDHTCKGPEVGTVLRGGGQERKGTQLGRAECVGHGETLSFVPGGTAAEVPWSPSHWRFGSGLGASLSQSTFTAGTVAS